MKLRMLSIVGTALLLAAGAAVAMQEGHIQVKFKEYPVNEEFRSVTASADPDDAGMKDPS